MDMELVKEVADVQAVSEREKLAQAVKQDQEIRVQRCKGRIEAALKDENCILTAAASMEEIQPGKFVTVTSPGIRAL